MKKIVYFIILTFSLNLGFLQGKPCCKNKNNDKKVSCKLNQTNINLSSDDNTLDEELITNNKTSSNCNNSTTLKSSSKLDCNGCKKVAWWKFWVKKKNCCNSKA